MGTAVVLPWRGGCPHREAALAWVIARYAESHPRWRLVLGSCTDGPWVKARAVADALTHTKADTLVIADADVWCDNLATTVAALTESDWAVPHRNVHRLDQASTAAVLAGAPLGGTYDERPYLGHLGGGIVALSRDLYEQVPLDPRFENWGREDDSWAVALRTLAGNPWRGSEPLWHLWHPPQQRPHRKAGSESNEALWQRYRHLLRQPSRMRELIEEAKGATWHLNSRSS